MASHLEGGSVEAFRSLEAGAGLLVELGDGVIVVSDEHARGEVTGGCDMAIPVVDRPCSRVVSVLSDDEPLVPAVVVDRPVDGAVPEVGERFPFPRVLLADVVGQFRRRKPVGESPEQSTGVDLG
jgi:hypothetical protein